MIDIWGADHHGYVCRVKAAMAAFGYDPDKLNAMNEAVSCSLV